MVSYKGFNLWDADKDVVPRGGSTTTIKLRANTYKENESFKSYIDTYFLNTSASYLLQSLSASGSISLRAMEVNSEDPNYKGDSPNAGVYDTYGSKNYTSLVDKGGSKYVSINDLYAGSPKAVVMNFSQAISSQYLSVTGSYFTPNTAIRSTLHELLHAKNAQDDYYKPEFVKNGDNYYSPYDEQIVIFVENFISTQLDSAASERVGHSLSGGAATGPSKSSVSYLRSSNITDYSFSNYSSPGDLSVKFSWTDGSSVRKTYYKGKTSGSTLNDYAGADRVEISYEGIYSLWSGTSRISDSKILDIIQQSAVQNTNPLKDLQNRLTVINSVFANRVLYNPQALVVNSGERITDKVGEDVLDIQGPRADSSNFIVTEAKAKDLFGFFDFAIEDLNTIIFGSAGWTGVSGSSAAALAGVSGVKDKLIGKGGNDIIISYSISDGNELYGGSGNDALFGSDHLDSIWGGSGSDTISGGMGFDKLYGESGNDVIFGDIGDDKLFGGGGDDVLIGGSGSDTLDGGSGADILVVDSNDKILVGETEDKLYAKNYDPTNPSFGLLAGGDRVVSVNDSQSFFEQIQTLLNSPTAFTGAMGEQYTVTYRGQSNQGLSVTLKSGETFSIESWHEGEYGISLYTHRNRLVPHTPFIFGGGATIQGIGLGIASIVFDTVMAVVGVAFDPMLAKFASDTFSLTRLDQLAGNPTLPPRTDTVRGTESDDEIHGAFGNNRILAGGGNDKVFGMFAADYIDGGSGDDTISAAEGDDTILGGTGDDVINGGAGNDDITTGAGKDVVTFGAGDGVDTVHADDDDVIRLQESIVSGAVTVRTTGASSTVSEYGTTTAGDVIISAGNDRIILKGGSFGRLEFADGVVMTGASLARKGLAASTTIGDDVMVGASSSERLAGGAGNDYLNGLGGNDI